MALRTLSGWLLVTAAAVAVFSSTKAWSGPANRTTYGDVGLLEMPTARTADDGHLSFTYGRLSTTQRFNLGFQLTPWLEASFRYSRLPKFLGNGRAEFDRSFGAKIRLWPETEYVPAVAVGIRDLLGTGVYSGEYVVASKQVGPVDLTAGLGWGRFAQESALPNPFAQIFPSFRTRDTSFGVGGTVAFGQFFHGPKIGLFGGALWRTPIENLDVLLEYSSDRYQNEAATGTYSVRLPVNVGLAYHVLNAFTFSAGWFYGSSYGVTLSIDIDPTVPNGGAPNAVALPPPQVRSPTEQVAALSGLVRYRAPPDALQSRTPWVQLPGRTAEASGSHSPMNELLGVDDFEIVGHTLLIAARFGATPAASLCARYASAASLTGGVRIETIALSDVSDARGTVKFCEVSPTRLAALENPAAGAGSTPLPRSFDPAAVGQKIRHDLSEQSIGTVALAVEPSTVWLYFSNGHYRTDTEAAGRAARLLLANAPPDVEIFHLISTRNGIPLRDYRLARSVLERASLASTSAVLPESLSSVPPPLDNPLLDRAIAVNYPKWRWDIAPSLSQNFFDPNAPIQFQVVATLHSTLELYPGVAIEFEADANVVNNHDLQAPSNSLLPHVRSDLNEYLRQGGYGVGNLNLVLRSRLTPEIFVEGKIGYLENMYAGVGGQVLWRPEGSRFSFGADLYKVWQRDFNRLAGLQNYSVLTGHVSMYYESPWYALNFAVHGGRYLAGDYGATFEITRRFSTGVEIGAFATLTNVPFARFGEGSFDKGLIVHIPMEWALSFFSQASYDLLLRSLTRDGGQRLLDDDSLYRETLPSSFGESFGHLDQLVDP